MKIKTFFHLKQPTGRHIAHATFWLMILLAIGFQFGWIDLSHDDEQFLVFMCLLSAGAMLVPWLLVKLTKLFKLSLSNINNIELFIAIMMILSWIGSLGLYRAGISYDTLVHFINSAFAALIALIIAHANGLEKRTKTWLIVILVFAIVMLSGIINELFEWGGDELIGTEMFGEIGEPTDTLKDMVANVAGFALGTYLGLKHKIGQF